MDDTGFYVPYDKLNRFAALYVGANAGGVDLADPPTAALPRQPMPSSAGAYGWAGGAGT